MHHEKHIQGSGRPGEAFGVRQASGAVRSTCARNPKRQRAAALQNLAVGRSFWSAPALWRCSLGLRAKSKAAGDCRTAMSFVKCGCGVFPFFLSIKSFFVFFSVCLSDRCRGSKTFSWRTQWSGHCSSCYPCTAPAGTAPVDSWGHRQETSAPNLQIGPLPAPVRLRARAVSNLLGRSVAWVSVAVREPWARLRRRPFASPSRPVGSGRCASATGPRPVGGPWRRWLFCAWLWWLWGRPAPATIF